MRGDVQEPDLRCGTFGTSGHVTTKSSIRNWGVLYKSGAYALKVTCLTPGGLPYAIASRLRLIAWLKGEQSTLTVWQESAEGIVGALSLAGMDGALRPCPGNRRYDEPQPGATRRCAEGPNGTLSGFNWWTSKTAREFTLSRQAALWTERL